MEFLRSLLRRRFARAQVSTSKRRLFSRQGLGRTPIESRHITCLGKVKSPVDAKLIFLPRTPSQISLAALFVNHNQHNQCQNHRRSLRCRRNITLFTRLKKFLLRRRPHRRRRHHFHHYTITIAIAIIDITITSDCNIVLGSKLADIEIP